MNRTIKISIIIPVYNVERYLRECLDSILNQSLADLEIILINDGSTDSSLNILEEYAEKDSRFIVVSQENQGAGTARNRGIELAKGEYLAFVDPDDYIETDAMEILYNYIKKNNAQVVQFRYREFNDYSKKYSKPAPFPKILKKNNNEYYNMKDIKRGHLYRFGMAVWNRIYSAEFIKDSHIVFAPARCNEDNLFSLSMLIKADKIYYLDKVLYTYRCRKSSITAGISDINFEVFRVIELFKRFLIQNNLFDELEYEFKEYMLNLLVFSYQRIPNSSHEKFKNRCLEFISEKEFNKIKSKFFNYKITERIFSIKNKRAGGLKYKVITIFGITIIKPAVKK